MSAVDEATRPHLDRSALLLIDVQRDFLDDGLAPIAGTSARLGAMRRLAQAYRDAGRPIVHVVRLYRGADVDLVRRTAIGSGLRLVAPGSPGSEIAEELLPAPSRLDAELLLAGRAQTIGASETILWKPRWSAFHRTELDAVLRAGGVDTVVVAGCNFPNCPRATLFDASERDYRAVLAGDATSGVTPERAADLEAIGVGIRSVDELATALAGRP